MKHGFYNNFGYSPILLIIIVIVVIAIIITLVKYLNSKKNPAIDMSAKQKDTLANFSSLVSAMLTQQGHGLKQIDICQNLNLSCEIVAEKLSEMENEGLISRVWENDDYTFTVRKIKS
jgi:hypothetical protein